MLFSTRNYAIGMAHFQIGGGLRGLVILVLGYFVLAGSVLGLIAYNADTRTLPFALHGVAAFMTVFQAIGLVLLGCGRIAGCIRTDTTTNMLESHRQMPLSAARAILSYLFGTPTQILALCACNALMLVIVCAWAGLNLDNVVIGQFVLAVFALMMGSFSAMAAFMFRQTMPLMVLGLIVGGISSATLRSYGILPGMTLLVTPFLGETIFNLSGGIVDLRAIYAVAVPAQLALAFLFFLGACRRYRGTYLTTFNAGMGVGLLSIWSGLSIAGIWVWSHFAMNLRNFGDQPETSSQMTASLTLAAVLLIVPLHAMVAHEARYGVSMKRRLPAIGWSIVAALLPLLMICQTDPQQCLLYVLVIAIHAWTLFAAFRLTRGMSAMAVGTLAVMLFLLLWITPLLLELTRWILLPPESARDMSFLSTLSPLGLMIAMWNTIHPPLWIGLVFQGTVAGLLWKVAESRQARLAAAALAATAAIPTKSSPSDATARVPG